MYFSLEDNKLQIPSLEINISWHCNLSCKGCSHFSPILSSKFIDNEKCKNDLQVLKRFLNVKILKLLGGEPLLNPNIVDLLDICRDSEIAKRICILTNGLFLHRIADYLWEKVDEIRISCYPGCDLSQDQISHILQKASYYNVQIRFYNFTHFREPYSEQKNSDQSLVSRIYKACYISHHWSCCTLHEGFIYRCPQSLFIPIVLDDNRLDLHKDALCIDKINHFSNLLRFFLSPSPLFSCNYCLGNVGKRFLHTQIKKSCWKSCYEDPLNFVDYDLLCAIESADQEIDMQVLDQKDYNIKCL